MGYELEGRLLEVCTCNVLCPCWVGEDPDGGTCDGILAWHADRGSIDGVDVSGRTLAVLAHMRISLNPITRFGVFDHRSVRASGSGVPVISSPA
jgi:hypothetical protein